MILTDQNCADRTAFGIKTRRHHCRLCGRVVCFLPPTPAPLPAYLVSPSTSTESVIPVSTRRQRCSTFITYEYSSSAVSTSDEKGGNVGRVVEIETIEPDLSMNGVMMEKNAPPKMKDERKKVRICRECLHVILCVLHFLFSFFSSHQIQRQRSS